ncbi:hypothetical protein [Streptomyces albofaciens]|uniref:hypothetical protein n=1 Tax=Streptomyces albofaciens TaxID=66866 RepID=UPI001AD79C14|nr:hypothetical protein [Streptomyces albofaciens]
MDSATALTWRDLEDRGFRGFVRFDELPSTDVPPESGIYVVLRSFSASPRFLATSPTGRRGDRDPTVSIDQLATKWVEGAQLVYIGKADAGGRGEARAEAPAAAVQPVGRRIVRPLGRPLHLAAP